MFKHYSVALSCSLFLTFSICHAEALDNMIVRNPFKAPAIALATANPASYEAANKNSTNNTRQNEPLQLKSIRLNYLTVKDLEPSLNQLLTNAKLTAEPISNSIFIYSTRSEFTKLQKLLKDIDKPSMQITLEAKVIALDRENTKDLGVSWNWDNIPKADNDSNSNSSSDSSYDGNFRFFRGYSFRFNAKLSALLTQGKATILASPRMLTIPGKEASIFIGDHIPVQTEKHNSSGSYTTTEYIDAGIKLTYTPIIDKKNKLITTSVHTEVSTPTLISELKNYRITSRTADTNVRLASGETLVIGGLINEVEQNTLQQIPLLSKLPILGGLFKYRSARKSKTEVIILLTPHITDAGKSPAIYEQETEISSALDEHKMKTTPAIYKQKAGKN